MYGRPYQVNQRKKLKIRVGRVSSMYIALAVSYGWDLEYHNRFIIASYDDDHDYSYFVPTYICIYS
jgi:hypothetical protein